MIGFIRRLFHINEVGIIGSSETVWDDLRITPGAFQFAGLTDPSLASWQPGGAGTTYKVYEFNNNDEVFFSVQLPHSYKEGTDLRAHVHWTPGDRGVAESGKTVAWKMDYSITNINGTFGSSSTVDLTSTCGGTSDKHEWSGSVSITGTGLKISAQLVGRLYRDAGDTWATNTAGNRPILLEIDLHYESDTIGSRTAGVK